jgi:hypothetical protein
MVMRHSRHLIAFLLCLVMIATTFSIHAGTGNPASAAVGDQQRIAYLDRQNNIWSARTDGSEAAQLTTSGGFSNVSMTADGSRILATGPYNGGSGVFLLSPDPDFGVRSIASGHSPDWSPDNARFAFIQDGLIHIFSRDGEFLRSASTPANVIEWSPDGQHIGFGRNIIDHYGSGCPVRQLGWIDANNAAVSTAGTMIGEFAWNGRGDALLHVSTVDGSLRARSVTGDSNPVVSTRLISPCNAPFFSTADGQRIVAARWSGDGNTDLIVIDQQSFSEQVYFSVPVRFPATRLPDAYITGDSSGRYVNLAQSYPTDIHRLDLETGQITPVRTNDWRRVLGFSPDGEYFALLNSPTGRPQELSIYSMNGLLRTMEDVGWLAWQPSPLNLSASVAWLNTWEREDRPVIAGESRTWLWGPEPFDARLEPYEETPGSYRAVRYYDKSRMEITRADGDRQSEWYVTNGLLVRELITGQLQTGDNAFIEREPAQIPVAGDDDSLISPTYATLQGLLDAPATAPGTEITYTLNQHGEIGDGGPGGVFAEHLVEASGHTVANVFWNYLNSTGTIWDGRQFTSGRLFEPTFFATGFPITEAYWVDVPVGGEQRSVLLQCFERRCLTYTPDNPEGWQVEMGNVGRHYHAWRYQ